MRFTQKEVLAYLNSIKTELYEQEKIKINPCVLSSIELEVEIQRGENEYYYNLEFDQPHEEIETLADIRSGIISSMKWMEGYRKFLRTRKWEKEVLFRSLYALGSNDWDHKIKTKIEKDLAEEFKNEPAILDRIAGVFYKNSHPDTSYDEYEESLKEQ